MEKLTIAKKEYDIVSILKEGEFSISYKCSHKGKMFFIKVFKDESSFKAELLNHKMLKKYGIRVPKLIKVLKNDLTLIYQFIEGENVLEVIAKQELDEIYFSELFEQYRFARFSKIELNYLPQNYVLYKNQLYYLSKEFIPQNKDKNLENYGICYWFYSEQLVELLKEQNIPIDKKRLLNKGEVNKKIVLTSIMKW